jgi:hypothetical protein
MILKLINMFKKEELTEILKIRSRIDVNNRRLDK